MCTSCIWCFFWATWHSFRLLWFQLWYSEQFCAGFSSFNLYYLISGLYYIFCFPSSGITYNSYPYATEMWENCLRLLRRLLCWLIFSFCDTIPKEKNGGKTSTSVHCFRGFMPLSIGSLASGLIPGEADHHAGVHAGSARRPFGASRRQKAAEKKVWDKMCPSKHTSSSQVFPPKVSSTSQWCHRTTNPSEDHKSPLAGNWILNTWAFWDNTSYPNHTVAY